MSPLAVTLTIPAVFLLLLLLYPLLLMPRRRRPEAAPLMRAVYAHRGLHGAAPENSLAAFRAACEKGYGIELDVQLTADGELVVFHDGSLSRMTGKDASLHSLTYAELRELRLGESAERVPTLREVLSLVDGRVPLLVEIKADHAWRAVCESAAALLRDYRGAYMIESFHPLAVAWFRRHAPEVVRGQLSSRLTRDKRYRGIAYFLVENLLLNLVARPDFIAYDMRYPKFLPLALCRRLYRPYTLAWTPRGGEEITLAAQTGVFDTVIFEILPGEDAAEALSPWKHE